MHKETPKFKETFHLQPREIQNKRKNKSQKKRHDKYVKNKKIIFYCMTPPPSQKCKETFHILFRSNNYGKYTGGFYIHYHSEASKVLSFSGFLE